MIVVVMVIFCQYWLTIVPFLVDLMTYQDMSW